MTLPRPDQMARVAWPLTAAAAIALLAVPLAAAQTGSPRDTAGSGNVVRVVPGPRYDAGFFHRLLLGARYRELWTTPIEVELLDLGRFAGGLVPLKRGGGQQTKSIRFQGADGREYTFRSVDKDPSQALPPALRSTAAADIVRDQTSSGHPVGALVVSPILEATGVLHVRPHLVVMPDGDPRLGEFEAEFGGMLGTIEERPDEVKGGPDFADAEEVIGTEKLLEEMQESPNDRVDARAYLSARLVDIFLGDWDRHGDQWRWASFSNDDPRRWVAIPRDRDQAFVCFDGLLLTVARASTPQLVKFGPSYAGILGQTWNGRDLDRRFLVGLERATWDSIAAELQAKLTDSVLEAAVARLPAAYIPIDSAWLAGALRKRRDGLRDEATRFYHHLAGEVDLHATDKNEVAVVTREDGRFTEVTLARADRPGDVEEPYFRRRFDHRETKEVRLFLHGGDDRVLVRGSGDGGVRVRVVAGAGADSLADSSRGGRVRLYATEADDAPLPGGEVAVRRDLYQPRDTAIRDWGDRWLAQTWFTSGPDIGVFLGSGVKLTRYGFRRDPFAERYRLRAGYSTGASTGRVELTAALYPENSPVHADLLMYASGIEVMRFHGFGNERGAPGPEEFFRVRQTDFTVAPSLAMPLASGLELRAGPVLKYSDTDLDPDRFIAVDPPYGSGNFGRIGAIGELRWDGRNRRHAATRGVFAVAGGGFYPGVWDADEAFGEVHGEVATYLTAAALPLEPTLALRVGGKRVWGKYPYQESAFIGDGATVRLGRQNRYAGDASLYGNAELRLFLTRFYLLAPGDFGVFGLGDVGRVYLEGEESDVWHAAGGGGIWASFIDRAYTMSLAVARSAERTGVYLTAGFGF